MNEKHDLPGLVQKKIHRDRVSKTKSGDSSLNRSDAITYSPQKCHRNDRMKGVNMRDTRSVVKSGRLLQPITTQPSKKALTVKRAPAC